MSSAPPVALSTLIEALAPVPPEKVIAAVVPPKSVVEVSSIIIVELLKIALIVPNLALPLPLTSA